MHDPTVKGAPTPRSMSTTSSEDEEKSVGASQEPQTAQLPALEAEISSTSPVTRTSTNTTVTPPPPDGGLRAWSQVLAALLVNALTWGTTYSYGVSQLHYTSTLKLPASQVSWIGSVQVFLVFACCAVSGRLTDAGFARETAATGCALATLGTFLTSLARKYWQILLAQGVCVGLGLGLVFMPALTVAGQYFLKRRAFAFSVAACGSSVGGLVFPSVLQYLTPKIGFPWAMRCAGFVMLLFSILANLLIRPRITPRRAGPWVEWLAFKELPYCLFALGSFLNFYGVYFALFYVSPFIGFAREVEADRHRLQINSYARNVIGFTTVEAVSLLLVTNAMGLPARPLAGHVADKYLGPINTFAVLQALFAAAIFGWTGVRTRTDMYVFCVFLGMITGSSQGLFLGALASLTKNPRKMGTRFGMVATICAFGTLAGPPTGGAIIDNAGGEYLGAQLWGGGVMLCSSLAIAASRVAATGWTWKTKI